MFDRFRKQRAARRLQTAFERSDPLLLQKALAAGASPDQPVTAVVGDAAPALQVAITAGLTEHARLLLQAGATTEPAAALLNAALRSQGQALPLLTLLLQHGVDANSDAAGALFTALETDNEATAQLLVSRLLEYGGHINATDSGGCSLLQRALKKEFRQLSRLLITAGAALPASLDTLDCSDEIKTLAKRCAEDLAIRHMLQGQ